MSKAMEKERAEFARRRLRQVRYGDVGVSSNALSHYVLGGPKPSKNERPWDYSDLNRCRLALNAMPPRLRAMARPIYNAWKATIEAEDESRRTGRSVQA